MDDRDQIAQIESAAYSSWPAKELVEYDGWQLRFADGFSRRANSLLPIGTSRVDLDAKLSFSADWFQQRGLSLVARCTPLCEPGIDEELARRGFAREGDTSVMVADLTGFDPPVVRDFEPDPRWWDTMAELWRIRPEARPAWRGIIERIDLPAAYGRKAIGGVDVAAGLGVLDGSCLGLFEIVVHPDRRRRGYGREVARSLLGWGKRQGATRAYLQVVTANEPAIGLYEDLGFRYAYPYWYRRSRS
jgi:GNAT superfamily N-acetyltransferase